MTGVILVVVAVLALTSCDGEPTVSPSPAPSPTATAAPSPTPEVEEPEPLGDEWPFVVFPEIGDVAVASACTMEGPDGPIYRADLENGGILELRKVAGRYLHASALPTPEADPVGTNVPSDSDWTEDGGWLSGTSVMWLQGTDNNITVEYHVRWDDSLPECV